MRFKNLLSIFKLYICFNLLCFTSCKYESSELNFHELKPPSKDTEVTLNLADVSTGQTIYIYSPTNLTYAINSTSGSIVKQEFFLNNKKLTPMTNASIYLWPSELTNGTNTLKVTVELSSGTGSLAEILGEEKSLFEFTYNVKYVNPQVNLNINQRINSSKKLEIFWEKPSVEGTEIIGYDIYNFNSLNQILVQQITDPNKTTFVDEDYAYGAKTYKVITKYKGNKIPQKEDFYSVKYKAFTTDYFETKTLKNSNLNIKWAHPDGIESKYVLVWKNDIKVIPIGKNSAEVDRPGYPLLDEQYYELYILPVKADTWNYAKYPKVINYFKEQTLGDGKDEYNTFILTEADYKNRLVLSLQQLRNDYGFRSFGLNDLTLNSKYSNHVQYPFYVNSLIVSPTTGVLALHLRSNIYETKPKIDVYSDYTFSTKIGSYPTDDFPVYFVTDNNKLLIANNNLYESKIYDLNSGALLSTKIEHTQFRPAISADGNYTMSYVGGANGWYRLYKYENDQYTLLQEKTSSRTINDIVFHPTIKNQVVIQSVDNYFSICELPNLNVIKNIPGEFLTIDRFTGNILFRDGNSASNSLLNVLDKQYENIIFSVRTGNYFQKTAARLINNNIIFNNTYINISN